MRVRLAALVAALAAVATLAACRGAGTPAASGDGTPVFGESPAATTAPGAAASTSAPPTVAPPGVRCDQLGNAAVGAVAFPLADYAGAGLVQLVGGRYTDADGTLIELLPACATGDLNGDRAVDAVAAVRIDPEGSATLYTLVVWLATESGPALAGSEALGDRNPVESISIADGIVTVVYFTRSPDVPLAGLDLRRTATYEFAEPGLRLLSSSDEPCSPCNP
jgi:hypothetical protein